MPGAGAALLLLLATATPAPQTPWPGDVPQSQAGREEPQPDEMVGAAAFARALEAKRPADQIIDLDSALAKLPRPTRFRGQVQCFRGWALGGLGRNAEAETAYAECYRLRPDDPYAVWSASFVALGKRDVRRGVRLMLAAVKLDPAPLADYDQSAMESILRQLSYERQDGLRAELITALSAAGFGRDDPAWTSVQARDALDALLAAGERERAAALLPLILVPRIGLELLIDRRYEALWPDIEGWAGGTLTAQRDAYVTATKAAFETDPSLASRRNYAGALSAAGRNAEARELLAAALLDQKYWDDTRYYIIMIAIRLSGMLEADGKVDEALATLRRIKIVTPLVKYEAASNIMPNEAQMLITAERYAEALKLLESETPPPSKVENRAALGFYTALQACALRGLKRDAEADGMLLALERDAPGNLAAQQIADGCARKPADQKARWKDALNSPSRRSEALLAFLDMKRQSPRPRDTFIKAPPVTDTETETLFNRLGRTLPASFDAALDGWTEATPSGR
jgi:hypothetical protein